MWDAGSSPRMRGTLLQQHGFSESLRFIPAYAGNATRRSFVQYAHSVHPRVCGERLNGTGMMHDNAGSSPRMRGTREHLRPFPFSERFIPAYAGNAHPSKPHMSFLSVHPRVCGERAGKRTRNQRRYGSSPRMRGTPSAHRQPRRSRRFIPAYAGNASLASPLSPGSPVHPRVCGERVGRARGTSAQFGSSPRMRGTLPE